MTIEDCIHGEIRLSPLCAAFCGHPHFQRLRQVRQIGSGFLVFPSAEHTRYEHSLGVCELARRMLDSLGVAEPALREGVLLAALCHDIGHAPFSHTFDRFGEVQFEHEERSQYLLLKMYEDLQEHPAVRGVLDPAGGARWAAPLIDPDRGLAASPEPYLEQIVNNVNIVDVDKLDYLMRDCQHLTGQPLGIDVYGIINRCAVCEGQLAFAAQDAPLLRQLLDLRTRFHRRYYCDVRVEASGWMLAQLVHGYLREQGVDYGNQRRFSEAVAALDDGILDRLEEDDSSPLRPLAQRIRQGQWMRHLRDVRHPPVAAAGRGDENEVVFTWDVEVSKHTSARALPRIPFHAGGEAAASPAPAPPVGSLLYRVFRQ